ncbi:membrane protein insertion efficiency factor YidD [Oceanobacillus damuensis]|uniref:membrane protein insertion efficiency factor YidD n=1 Tax=Oceanobacillus damuensis TaxID=937928 RepID=UPI00082CCF03|nr:membrane protein insertion efficiency factor YidD [Oceanobacillus damuensis]
MKFIFIGIIKFYRAAISPFTPSTCRFHPTCSEYGLEAFKRFGAMKGFYLTIRRISKCHPFHPGGVDFVPERPRKRNK